jgi:DNA repair exonuclease SbcCD ATPase subunit
MGAQPLESKNPFDKARELLEQELKWLRDLKAQVLKSKKNKEDKQEELWRLDQEILEKEKAILKLKLEELKSLREQILSIENNTENKDKKEVKKAIKSVDLHIAFEDLEQRINTLWGKWDHTFEDLNKEIDENLETFRKNLQEIEKKTWENLSNLNVAIYYQRLEKLLPGHNPVSLYQRAVSAHAVEEALRHSSHDKNENFIARGAAKIAMNILQA